MTNQMNLEILHLVYKNFIIMENSLLNSKTGKAGFIIILIASIVTLFRAGIDFGKWLFELLNL